MKTYLKYSLNQNYKEMIISDLIKLPFSLQKKIGAYTNLNKQRQRIDGLLLLQEAILDFELDPSIYNLNTIKYTENGKPFFDDKVAFSLAYTDNCSVIVFNKFSVIGVDIEKLKSIEITDYKDYFTTKEWLTIVDATNTELQFYFLWTRKEALAKAIGLGMFIAFNELEVLNNVIALEKKWSIQTEVLDGDYILSVVQELN